jgi:hypothetical protein
MARNHRHADFAGSKNPMAKLNEEQVEEIRRADEPHVLTARRYKVSPTTICLIRKRQAWTHM